VDIVGESTEEIAGTVVEMKKDRDICLGIVDMVDIADKDRDCLGKVVH